MVLRPSSTLKQNKQSFSSYSAVFMADGGGGGYHIGQGARTVPGISWGSFADGRSPAMAAGGDHF